MKTQISVIGCGWLGLDLAKQLIEEGFVVKGSTTSSDKLQALKKQSIEPFLVRLDPLGISGDYSRFLSGSETVIINIPPGLRKNPDKNHVSEIRHLMHAIEAESIKNVLYISSTSVFENEENFPIITAETAPNATSKVAKQLIAIEVMLQENPNFKTTILRFGGLFNKERHPARMLEGRNNLSNPEAPLNLIHKTDCISIILCILKKQLWSVTLNAAYPKHPNKKTYYSEYCKAAGLALPMYKTSEESKGKLIESKILVQLLNYSFQIEP